MKNYIKQLEEQNADLHQKLVEATAFIPVWVEEDKITSIDAAHSKYWYYILGKQTVLAVVHYVKDVNVEGYKMCVLLTPKIYSKQCNVEAFFVEGVTTESLENAKKYCEERIMDERL